MDRFTADITARARWALDYNDGHPNPAWSTGEKLAVALVLNDQEFLTAEEYTKQEAAQRISGDVFTTDIGAWIDHIRSALGMNPRITRRHPRATRSATDTGDSVR